MEKHVRYLGIITIIVHILIPVLIAVLLPIIVGLSAFSDEGSAPVIAGSIGMIVLVVVLLFSLPGIIGGYGLLKHKSWARIVVLIVNGINVLSFPIGTALALYTFWVLFNDETRAILE